MQVMQRGGVMATVSGSVAHYLEIPELVTTLLGCAFAWTIQEPYQTRGGSEHRISYYISIGSTLNSLWPHNDLARFQVHIVQVYILGQ